MSAAWDQRPDRNRGCFTMGSWAFAVCVVAVCATVCFLAWVARAYP